MLIEDTRQQKGKHELKHQIFDLMGVEVITNKLPFGDYAYPPSISVDTKRDMGEIAENLTVEHGRFRRECQLAQKSGSHLYILVETEWNIETVDDVHLWVNPRSPLSPRAVTGARLEKMMKTMEHRYGVRFMFCHPMQAAEQIIRILNGEYENE